MKTFSSWIGLALTLLSVAWPFLAVCLSAHQLLRTGTERLTCLLCFVGAFLGPLWHWGRTLEKSKALNAVLAIAIPFVATGAVFKARAYSDRMFTFWIMRRIPQSAWQQMASDSRAIAQDSSGRNQFYIAANSLPQSLRRLGRNDD